MQVHAGKRDTLITFQAASRSQESTYGTYENTWADVTPDEWAEVQDVLPSRSESVEEGLDITARRCRIRTLYRSDITPQHRVKIGSRVLQIVSGPVVLGTPGRPQGLEMMCTEYSSTGEAP